MTVPAPNTQLKWRRWRAARRSWTGAIDSPGHGDQFPPRRAGPTLSRPVPARQANPAGENGKDAVPEGATAPETLRAPDRGGMNTLESASAPRTAIRGLVGGPCCSPPKE